MNQDQPKEPTETPSADPERVEAPPPPEAQSRDSRRRLRELLAVPERDRTDAVWDEIVSLEIELAPGNRAPSGQNEGNRSREPSRGQGQGQGQGRRPDQARRQQGASDGKQPGKRFFKRPKRGPSGPNKA
jgi:hypothetical protein